MRTKGPSILSAAVLLLAVGCAGGETATPDARATPTGPASATVVPATATPGGSPATTADVTAETREIEMAITEAVNAQRREHGLGPLEHRDDLAAVARSYSAEMVEQDFFDHVDPSGQSVSDRVREAGITYTAVGENLYGASGPVGMVDHVERSVSGWMDSPGHRENILREVFTQTGVGMSSDGDTVRITQVFLTP